MDGRIVRSVVFLAVSVCLLVAGISESKRVLADFFLGNGISRNSRKTIEETAEQVWIQCRKEVDGGRNVNDLDFHLPQAITDLHSQVKHTLFDCLRNRNAPFHVPAQELVGSKSWFNKCVKLLYGWPNVPRRYLVSRPVRNRAVSHATKAQRSKAKSPADDSEDSSHSDASSAPPPKTRKRPPPSPDSSPPPSPEPSPPPKTRKPPPPQKQEPPPSPDPPPPSRRSRKPPPSPSPEPPPSPSPPPPSESPPPPSKTSPPPPETSKPPPPPPSPTSQSSSNTPNPQDDATDSHGVHTPPKRNAAPSHESEENSAVQKYVIASAGATAVATLFLIVLLFVCCRKANNDEQGPTDGQRDEKPLLNLCSGDMSPGIGPPALRCPADEKSRNEDPETQSIFKNPIIKADGNCSSRAEADWSGAPSSEATPLASGNANAPSPPPPPPPKAAPPPPPPKPPAPKPPPPPMGARPPPLPPKSGKLPRPAPPRRPGSSSSGEEHDLSSDSDARKTKLKPLFWDKVPANPDHTMVWHDIKAGSFQFNEEMMETLFGYAPKETGKVARKKDLSSSEAAPQYIQIIDPKKAQNLSIILRALNVTTEEVCDALKEGNELPGELVQSLLRMAPTTEEELKLRLFSGDLSQLGPADRFLKVMVDIPFAFKKMEALLFMSSLQSEISSIKESFATLEVASKDLRNSRLFLKLLEAVLKTGNRMNDGTFRGGAQAFKLDTLLKLSDVKGTDGKTTLLHFVVQQIIRSEGVRAARATRPSLSLSSLRSEDLAEDSNEETEGYYRSLGLQVVSGLSTELASVKKAALIDGDTLTGSLSKLGQSLSKTQAFLDNELDSAGEKTRFRDTLANFVQNVEADIKKLLEEEKSIMAQVKSTGDYFHGNAGKDEGLHLFAVVRDFLIILDRECKEVSKSASLPKQSPSKGALKTSQSQDARQPPVVDIRQKLFPAIMDRRTDDSDDDCFSP